MEYAIRTKNLTKVYRSREKKGFLPFVGRGEVREVHALKELDLEIERGELFGILGPNGAGKTTLIKILTTLLLPTSGEAWVNGYPLERDKSIKASIGCMLMGERGLYWKLTGRENLDYFSALYHIPKQGAKKRIDYLIDLLELEEYVDRTVETYSSGQKMRLVFARALISDAPILLLDEPTNTLDVQGSRQLRAIVRNLNREGKTVLYCTHVMSEAEELCDRVAIIDLGRIVGLGGPNELKTSLDQEDRIDIEGIFPSGVEEGISSLPGVKNTFLKQLNGNGSSLKGEAVLSITCSESSRKVLPRIMESLQGDRATISYIKPRDVTLEDVFLKHTGRTLSEDTTV